MTERTEHFIDLDGIMKPVTEADDDKPPQFVASIGGVTIVGERRSDEYRRDLRSAMRDFDAIAAEVAE